MSSRNLRESTPPFAPEPSVNAEGRCFEVEALRPATLWPESDNFKYSHPGPHPLPLGTMAWSSREIGYRGKILDKTETNFVGWVFCRDDFRAENIRNTNKLLADLKIPATHISVRGPKTGLLKGVLSNVEAHDDGTNPVDAALEEIGEALGFDVESFPPRYGQQLKRALIASEYIAWTPQGWYAIPIGTCVIDKRRNHPELLKHASDGALRIAEVSPSSPLPPVLKSEIDLRVARVTEQCLLKSVLGVSLSRRSNEIFSVGFSRESEFLLSSEADASKAYAALGALARSLLGATRDLGDMRPARAAKGVIACDKGTGLIGLITERGTGPFRSMTTGGGWYGIALGGQGPSEKKVFWWSEEAGMFRSLNPRNIALISRLEQLPQVAKTIGCSGYTSLPLPGGQVRIRLGSDEPFCLANPDQLLRFEGTIASLVAEIRVITGNPQLPTPSALCGGSIVMDRGGHLAICSACETILGPHQNFYTDGNRRSTWGGLHLGNRGIRPGSQWMSEDPIVVCHANDLRMALA